MIYLHMGEPDFHTVSELHLEFMGKSKHLHSFTPPIPADQLINRALTPAVYLPLNTLLIRLHPTFLCPGVGSSQKKRSSDSNILECILTQRFGVQYKQFNCVINNQEPLLVRTFLHKETEKHL